MFKQNKNIIQNIHLLLKPTKIYVKEINKLNDKKLINGCANITGGGLIENLTRVIPNKFCLNIDDKATAGRTYLQNHSA